MNESSLPTTARFSGGPQRLAAQEVVLVPLGGGVGALDPGYGGVDLGHEGVGGGGQGWGMAS